MSGEIIGGILLLGVFVVVPVVAVIGQARENARQQRNYEFERGYLEGWRDCRDGHPPKDFP